MTERAKWWSTALAVLLVIVVVVVTPLPTAAQPQPFAVPRVEGLDVKAEPATWKEAGFRVDTMAPADGDIRGRLVSGARFRVAWDDRGLRVLVTVHDATPADEPSGSPLSRGDSVEVLLGRFDTIDRYLLTISPGRTPAHHAARSSFTDMRQQMADRHCPLKASVVATTTEDGYVVEALLPWENLGLRPQAGQEWRLQVRVNDANPNAGRDAPPSLQFRWHPAAGNNFKSTERIRLATTAPSSAIEMAAAGRYERFRRIRVGVVAPREAAGQHADVVDGDKVLASETLELRGGDSAAAELVVPMPPAGQSYGTLSVRTPDRRALLDLPDVQSVREKALAEAPLSFKSFVFTGNRFPDCDFEDPTLVDELIGPYTLRRTFYDDQFNEVARPTKPGRYGAIVEVQAPGATFKRFATLYRTAGSVDWEGTMSALPEPTLPATLGIDPAVASRESAMLWPEFGRLLRDESLHRPELAAFLAGLHEIAPDAPPQHDRDAPAERDRRWWYQLKRKTGEFVPYPCLTYLPVGYDRDPNKRWPLILSLHGAGERGVPLDALKAWGIPMLCERGGNVGFIAVCPQCPPNESWLPAALNDLLDDVCAKYRVDPDRIYVTGASMGGNGTWNFAQQYPQRVAAIAPVCGGGDPDDVTPLRDVPAWIFHGEDDPVVPFRRARAMCDALSRIGGRVRITSYPGVGHESWNAAYATPDLLPWLLQQRRGHPQQPPATQAASTTQP